MGLAVAGDAGYGHILHEGTDAVRLQHVEHIVQGGVVGDDAQAVAAVLQGLQHLPGIGAQLPVVKGHLIGVGQFFRDGQQLLPVKGEVPQIPVRPDLLRLFLQHVALAPLLVGLHSAEELLPEDLLRAAGIQAVVPQDLQELPGGLLLGLFVVPDILQGPAHIE